MDATPRVLVGPERSVESRSYFKTGSSKKSYASFPQPCLGFLCSCAGSCIFGAYAIVLATVLVSTTEKLKSEVKVKYACFESDSACECLNSTFECSIKFEVHEV